MVTIDVREVLQGIRCRLGAAPRHAKAVLTVAQEGWCGKTQQ